MPDRNRSVGRSVPDKIFWKSFSILRFLKTQAIKEIKGVSFHSNSLKGIHVLYVTTTNLGFNCVMF